MVPKLHLSSPREKINTTKNRRENQRDISHSLNIEINKVHSKETITTDTRSPKAAANEEIFSEEEFWCTRKLRRKNNRNNIDMLYDS